MSFYYHIFIATCYTMVAAAVAFILPHGVPAIDANGAIVVGGVLLIGSALTHELFARQEEEGRIADALQSLRLEQDEAMRELADAREPISGLQHGLERALAGGGMNGGGRDVDSVIAEVKVLQSLIERLSGRTTREPGVGEPGEAEPRNGAESGAAEMGDPAQGDADGAVLMPQQNIAIADREGLITAIDNMRLFRCVQLVRKTQRLNQNIGFFCNFSAHSLTDGHFFDNFVEFKRGNRALAPNLIFEFPQSAVVNRDAEMEAQLKHLPSLSFRFSMDQVAVVVVTTSLTRGSDSRPVTFYVQVLALIFVSLFLIIVGDVQLPETPGAWADYLLLPILYGVGVTTFFAANAIIGSVRSSLIMKFEPVAAIILRYLILDQVITPLQLLGGGIVISALLAAKWAA